MNTRTKRISVYARGQGFKRKLFEGGVLKTFYTDYKSTLNFKFQKTVNFELIYQIN